MVDLSKFEQDFAQKRKFYGVLNRKHRIDVLNFLQEHGATRAIDIAKGIDVVSQQANSILKDLVDCQLVESNAYGFYEIHEEGFNDVFGSEPTPTKEQLIAMVVVEWVSFTHNKKQQFLDLLESYSEEFAREFATDYDLSRVLEYIPKKDLLVIIPRFFHENKSWGLSWAVK